MGALRLEDLPQHPQQACNTPEVRTALLRCVGPNEPTAACCDGLDGVFANTSSPSAG